MYEPAGMITPCEPVNPLSLQMVKKPSTFSLTLPIGCSSPFWLIEPVTASDWWIGSSESAESRA